MEEMYQERQSRESSKIEEDENVFEIYKKFQKRETEIRSKKRLCQAATNLVFNIITNWEKFINFATRRWKSSGLLYIILDPSTPFSNTFMYSQLSKLITARGLGTRFLVGPTKVKACKSYVHLKVPVS